MCRIFCLQETTTLWDEIGCRYWGLAKDGPDLAILLLTALTCRKEAATPTYTE